MSHGEFSEEPRTKWLTEKGEDRRMEMLALFEFTDPDEHVWDAPEGSGIDGASIPRALWSLAGSPYTGDYRRASIVHDIACDRAGADKEKRRAADRMFYHACRAGGCSPKQALLLYLGVRIGALRHFIPRWAETIREDDKGPRLHSSSAEDRMVADYQRAGEMVQGGDETDDAYEVERRVDEALSQITLVDTREL